MSINLDQSQNSFFKIAASTIELVSKLVTKKIYTHSIEFLNWVILKPFNSFDLTNLLKSILFILRMYTYNYLFIEIF